MIDVVDGPTPVQRVRMVARPVHDRQDRRRFRFVEAPEPLCETTPCRVDLSPGNVLLGFPVAGRPGAREVELVHVGAAPTVYRRALSQSSGEHGAGTVLGVIGASAGGAALMTGAALLPIGIDAGSEGMTWAGGVCLGAGALALTLGILALHADATHYRPGASIHFPLAAPPR